MDVKAQDLVGKSLPANTYFIDNTAIWAAHDLATGYVTLMLDNTWEQPRTVNADTPITVKR